MMLCVCMVSMLCDVTGMTKATFLLFNYRTGVRREDWSDGRCNVCRVILMNRYLTCHPRWIHKALLHDNCQQRLQVAVVLRHLHSDSYPAPTLVAELSSVLNCTVLFQLWCSVNVVVLVKHGHPHTSLHQFIPEMPRHIEILSKNITHHKR